MAAQTVTYNVGNLAAGASESVNDHGADVRCLLPPGFQPGPRERRERRRTQGRSEGARTISPGPCAFRRSESAYPKKTTVIQVLSCARTIPTAMWSKDLRRMFSRCGLLAMKASSRLSRELPTPTFSPPIVQR